MVERQEEVKNYEKGVYEQIKDLFEAIKAKLYVTHDEAEREITSPDPELKDLRMAEVVSLPDLIRAECTELEEPIERFEVLARRFADVPCKLPSPKKKNPSANKNGSRAYKRPKHNKIFWKNGK